MAARTAVRKRSGPSRLARTARGPAPNGDARPALRTVKPPLTEQYHVAVDRQLKSSYPTYEDAEKAALAIKRHHPRLDVTVYDAKDDLHTTVVLSKP